MPPILSESAIRSAHIVKLLAHPIRMQMILAFRNGGRELSVTELEQMLSISQSLTSHHLGLLKKGGILVSRSSANERFYSLSHIRYAESLYILLNE